MNKQELIHLNGLLEAVAGHYDETYSDIVEQYLEEFKQGVSMEEAYPAEQYGLQEYLQNTSEAQYTDIHKSKPVHRTALLQKTREINAFQDYLLDADAEEKAAVVPQFMSD